MENIVKNIIAEIVALAIVSFFLYCIIKPGEFTGNDVIGSTIVAFILCRIMDRFTYGKWFYCNWISKK